MFRYKLFRKLFHLYILAGIAGVLLKLIPAWPLYLGLFLFLIVLLFGVFNLKLSFFLPVFYRGKPGKKQLLLTFDDGPDPEYTPKILKILNNYDVEAIFFCVGKKVRKYPDIVKKMVAKGHVVGNHTWTHSWKFTFAGTDQVRKELLDVERLIDKITGKRPRLFRPPFGVTNPIIAKAVQELNYNTVGWSIRSLDTVLKPDRMKLRVMHQIDPGKVILFHDNRKGTVEMLPEIIEDCISHGYEFAGVEEVLGLKPYV